MPKQAVLFLIDTQGTNCVGCYADDPALGTPNVDRLASEGTRFERAYTCSPVCGPARSAIFTGMYPHSNGVLGNSQAPHCDIPTLGQRLTGAGVRAAYIGKWHLDGTDYFGNGHCPPGWDAAYWFDGRNYLRSLPDDAARDLSRRVLGPREVAEYGITAEFTHAHRTAERAREFLQSHRDEDFLLVVSIDEPHHPFICPEPFVSAFDDYLLPVTNAEDPLTDKPRGQQEWAAHLADAYRRQMVEKSGRTFLRNPRYFACNSFSDHEVGRVLAAVGEYAPDALVVYTSDHGEMFGSHGLAGKGPVMYEEITHIPLIVRWPGRVPPGATSEPPVSHIDLVPTLLEFFGAAVPEILQGRSLLGQACDGQQATHEAVFIEFNRFELDHDGFGAFAPIRCVFDGRHKLAIHLLDTDELYDLQADPGEMRNLIADPACADIRNRLHGQLLAWMDATRDPMRGPHWKRRAWREIPASTWGGPTRPRPADPAYFETVLLYDNGREADRPVYNKF